MTKSKFLFYVIIILISLMWLIMFWLCEIKNFSIVSIAFQITFITFFKTHYYKLLCLSTLELFYASFRMVNCVNNKTFSFHLSKKFIYKTDNAFSLFSTKLQTKRIASRLFILVVCTWRYNCTNIYTGNCKIAKRFK